MGTNYYVETTTHGQIHFGKSSAGWVFSLHVYPDLGINSLGDWVAVLLCSAVTRRISNEYGDTVSFREMMEIVVARRGKLDDADGAAIARDASCEYVADWKLFRQPEARDRKHGMGTWSCCNYEFS